VALNPAEFPLLSEKRPITSPLSLMPSRLRRSAVLVVVTLCAAA
jgi:hypothetical protein